MAHKERKLTAAEMARKEKFEDKVCKLESEGYKRKDLTVSAVSANIMALVLMLPIVVLLSFLNYSINQRYIGVEMTKGDIIKFIIAFFILIIIHEMIHGLTWACFVKDHFKSIEFGVIWSALMPYCTCNTEMRKGKYILGAIMPTIILGIIPAFVAIFINSPMLFLVALAMTVSGGGDVFIVIKLLFHKEKGKVCLYLDHPYDAGLVVFEK